MTIPVEFRAAVEFMESVFQAEHQHGLACIELLREAYAQKPISWDKIKSDKYLRSLNRKHLTVPTLQNTNLLSPPFIVMEPREAIRRYFEIGANTYRKRFFYKVSLYKSTTFGQVWRFLVPSVQNRFMTIHGRWDVVVQEDSMRLANIGQSICQSCFGAATVTNIECACEEPGYLFPPKNDLGVVGSPTAIFRSNIQPDDRYKTIFNGDC